MQNTSEVTFAEADICSVVQRDHPKCLLPPIFVVLTTYPAATEARESPHAYGDG